MVGTKAAYRRQAALKVWTGTAIYHGIEIVPRTGLNLRRYKRKLMKMAEPVCPPDKTWQVVILYVAVFAMCVYAFAKWWFLW